MPIVFCASLVPCASAMSDAEPIWPQRNDWSLCFCETRRVMRVTSHVPVPPTAIAMMGATSAGIITLETRPLQITPSDPAAASTAPTTPPTRACEELDGSRTSHVTRFQMIPPARPASTTASVTTAASTMPFAMVAATVSDRNAPTMLSTAASMTACLGLRARVAMDGAIALPVSWKPLVKSKTRAVTTTSTRRAVSVTASIVEHSVAFRDRRGPLRANSQSARRGV